MISTKPHSKVVLLVIFVLTSSWVLAAKKEVGVDTLRYQVIVRIPYRNAKLQNLDAYGKENCQLDLYYPTNKKAFATIVWFHGGSLTGGKKEIPEKLMKQGFAVVGVEYRKSPIVDCKSIIEDAAAAVAWTFNNIPTYGGDTTQIFLSGHSAGGYLDLMLGMDKSWLAKYKIDANRIAGLLPLSPQTITHFTIRKERGIPDTQPIIDEYAPLFHVRKDLPPLVIITGDRELEMLGRYEENAYLMRMMKVCGHTKTSLYELDGFTHGTMMQPGLLLLLTQVKALQKK